MCSLRGADGGPREFSDFSHLLLEIGGSTHQVSSTLGDFRAWMGLSHFYCVKNAAAVCSGSWFFTFFALRKAVKLVAGPGIEPGTRGFSILLPLALNRIKPSIDQAS